jgi:hypothetical protein
VAIVDMVVIITSLIIIFIGGVLIDAKDQYVRLAGILMQVLGAISVIVTSILIIGGWL